jgi:predicted ATPase
MITKLDITNLRSFDRHHEVPLAPITLVYGPNSAGKSTLIQSLAVLKQTLDATRHQIGPQRRGTLALRGGLVDLGSFPTAVHAHDLALELALGVSVQPPASRAPLSVELSFGAGDGDVAVLKRSTVGIGAHKMDFAWEESAFMLKSQTALRELLQAQNEPVHRASAILSAMASEDQNHPARAERDIPFLISDRVPLFPGAPQPRAWLDGYADEDMLLGHWWVDTVFERFGDFEEALDRMSYLGPMRTAPSRFQTLSATNMPSTHVTGEYTTRLLVENLPNRSGEDVQSAVNRWLERLEVNYRLAVTPVRTTEVGVEIGDLVATALIDARNGIPVTPQDVGYGISQLLPIVVQLLASEDATICIEQPEVHIHPRLQTRLGELLIEATDPQGLNNQVIVETHSEHLLLRLLRHIRHHDMSPDRVSVLYIDRNDINGFAKPQRLPIDSRGEFTRKWPGGFFDERVQELGPLMPRQRARR